MTLFRNMNDALCEDSRIDTYMSGTTAAVVFVWTSSRRLTVAHVGDSRVLAAWRNPDGTYRTEQITMCVIGCVSGRGWFVCGT